MQGGGAAAWRRRAWRCSRGVSLGGCAVQDGGAAAAGARDGGGPGDAEGVYAWVAVLEPLSK